MNKLNAHNQKLQARSKELEQKIYALEQQAKNFLRKSKETKGSTRQMYKKKCMMALKKKKQLQQQLKGTMSHQIMIQNAQMTHENITGHKEMMQNMKDVIKEQKEALAQVDIDKMEDLKDQMMDMKFESDYMNEMLNRNYEMDLDEEDFEDDFAEFERQVAREKKSVQTHKVQPQKQQNISNNNWNSQDFDINKL